jgi:CheY-like chemotaxis protein
MKFRVALSANALPDQKEIALEAGFDTYLTKPIELKLIRGVINELEAAN